jgi:formamidopyrimidine-DNA glycosylase
MFFQGVSRSRSPIRSWLLDQAHLAGIGNIYANEALFRAQIHPLRAAGSLRRIESARLLKAIRTVLREAIAARGTTLRDYRTTEGDTGSFGPRLRVYGREGLPCHRCGGMVARIVFGNRSAFLCPVCQKEESSSES